MRTLFSSTASSPEPSPPLPSPPLPPLLPLPPLPPLSPGGARCCVGRRCHPARARPGRERAQNLPASCHLAHQPAGGGRNGPVHEANQDAGLSALVLLFSNPDPSTSAQLCERVTLNWQLPLLKASTSLALLCIASSTVCKLNSGALSSSPPPHSLPPSSWLCFPSEASTESQCIVREHHCLGGAHPAAPPLGARIGPQPVSAKDAALRCQRSEHTRTLRLVLITPRLSLQWTIVSQEAVTPPPPSLPLLAPLNSHHHTLQG